MSEFTVSALAKMRAELAGEPRELEARVAQLGADLFHLTPRSGLSTRALRRKRSGPSGSSSAAAGSGRASCPGSCSMRCAPRRSPCPCGR